MLADHPDLQRHIQRYEFNGRLLSDTDRERSAAEVRDDGWDAVAVLWFDWVEEMRALSSEPAMAPIRDRALEFRAEERLIVLTEEPEMIVADPRRDEAGAKMLCILQRGPGPRHLPRPLAASPRRPVQAPRAARAAAGLRAEPWSRNLMRRSTASPSSGSNRSTLSSSRFRFRRSREGQPGRRLHARSGQHPLRDDEPARRCWSADQSGSLRRGRAQIGRPSGAVGVAVLGGGRVITATPLSPSTSPARRRGPAPHR